MRRVLAVHHLRSFTKRLGFPCGPTSSRSRRRAWSRRIRTHSLLEWRKSSSARETRTSNGVLVPDHGFFYTRPVNPDDAEDDDYFHVRYTTDHPLLAFKSLLLQGLATFPRPPQSWVPAVDLYFSHQPQWYEQVPSASEANNRLQPTAAGAILSRRG